MPLPVGVEVQEMLWQGLVSSGVDCTLWLSDCRQFATKAGQAIFLPLEGEKGNLGQVRGHRKLAGYRAAGFFCLPGRFWLALKIK